MARICQRSRCRLHLYLSSFEIADYPYVFALCPFNKVHAGVQTSESVSYSPVFLSLTADIKTARKKEERGEIYCSCQYARTMVFDLLTPSLHIQKKLPLHLSFNSSKNDPKLHRQYYSNVNDFLSAKDYAKFHKKQKKTKNHYQMLENC